MCHGGWLALVPFAVQSLLPAQASVPCSRVCSAHSFSARLEGCWQSSSFKAAALQRRAKQVCMLKVLQGYAETGLALEGRGFETRAWHTCKPDNLRPDVIFRECLRGLTADLIQACSLDHVSVCMSGPTSRSARSGTFSAAGFSRLQTSINAFVPLVAHTQMAVVLLSPRRSASSCLEGTCGASNMRDQTCSSPTRAWRSLGLVDVATVAREGHQTVMGTAYCLRIA